MAVKMTHLVSSVSIQQANHNVDHEILTENFRKNHGSILSRNLSLKVVLDEERMNIREIKSQTSASVRAKTPRTIPLLLTALIRDVGVLHEMYAVYIRYEKDEKQIKLYKDLLDQASSEIASRTEEYRNLKDLRKYKIENCVPDEEMEQETVSLPPILKPEPVLEKTPVTANRPQLPSRTQSRTLLYNRRPLQSRGGTARTSTSDGLFSNTYSKSVGYPLGSAFPPPPPLPKRRRLPAYLLQKRKENI